MQKQYQAVHATRWRTNQVLRQTVRGPVRIRAYSHSGARPRLRIRHFVSFAARSRSAGRAAEDA